LRQKQQIEEATWSNPGMRNFLGEQAGSEDAGAGMGRRLRPTRWTWCGCSRRAGALRERQCWT